MWTGSYWPSNYWTNTYWAKASLVVPAVTRYYMVAKAPNAVIHGPFMGDWQDGVQANFPWAPVAWQWELSSSKTNGGTVDKDNTIFTNQNAVSNANQSFWTPRLTAQTVSGTLDWCWHLYAAWRDGMVGPTDDTDAWVKVYAYITVGDSTEVRHVLIDNHVEPVPMLYTYDVLAATSAASPIPLIPGDTLDGDRIRIELGFYAEMPTPAPSQRPIYYSEILWLVPGATGDDLTPGESEGFFTQRSPWLEFSNALQEAVPVAPPANGTCATAITVPALPYHSTGVDCSQATGTARETWWTWTSTVSGEMLAHVFGSNFYAVLDVRTDEGDPLVACPGYFVPGVDINYADSLTQHRGTSTATFLATTGWRYWFRVYNKTLAGFNVANGGGIARFGLVERATGPLQDDLYMPQGNTLQVRDGLIVNLTPVTNAHAASGVAIDYTLTPMNDLNGGVNTSERILVGLFADALVEVYDLATLSYTLAGTLEIDYLELPTPATAGYNWKVSTLHIRQDGRLYVATFGTGFEHVNDTGPPGSQPAYLDTVSDDAADSDVLQWPVGVGSDANAPLPAPTRFSPTAAVTSPWAITLDETNNILYYTDGSLYYPVGGQTVHRWDLDTDTALPDLITLSVPASAIYLPGVKGLLFIPHDGSLLVCNATEVVHVSAAGSIVGTYVPSVPLDSQALVDCKLQADGQTFWVADLPTGRLYKVDLATMTEIATYETWQTPGTLTQMAIYQPGGIAPPPVPAENCPGGGLLIADGTVGGHGCTTC